MKVSVVPGPNTTAATSFRIGSHKDDVARLEGTPYRVSAPLRRTRASLQQERRENRELGIRPNPDDEVIDDNISGLNDDSDRETWYFQGGAVEISVATGRVTAWGSVDNSFNTAGRTSSRGAAGTADGEHFGIGSTKDQVSRIQGPPRSTRTREFIGEEDWSYPGGTVKFESASGRVIYWENRDNSLMTMGIRPDYSTFAESAFIRARTDRLKARRLRQEKETNRTALYGCLGCLGILVVGFVLIATCGAILLKAPQVELDIHWSNTLAQEPRSMNQESRALTGEADPHGEADTDVEARHGRKAPSRAHPSPMGTGCLVASKGSRKVKQHERRLQQEPEENAEHPARRHTSSDGRDYQPVTNAQGD